MFPRRLGFHLPFFTFSANLITRQKGTTAAILHLQSVKIPRSRNHAEYTTKTCLLWLLVIMPTMYQQTRSSSSQLEVALVVAVVVVVVVAVVAVAAVAAVVDAVDAVDVEVVADAVADVVIDLGRNSKFLGNSDHV